MEWSYFDKYDAVCDRYLPVKGEGETRASQIVTAVCQLVYKWYNDGDVFDNTHELSGWLNDLSSYANWLHTYTNAGDILERVWECSIDSDYEDLLADLADALMDDEDLEALDRKPKVGSIYDCDGPFEFKYTDENDEDNEW